MIQWAHNALAALVQYIRANMMALTRQFLRDADIVAVFQQMRDK